MLSHPFRLNLPEPATSCAVFCTAHSGSEFPAEFIESSLLSKSELRTSEDAFVDRMIDSAPDMGAPVLAANFSRAYIDLNRSASDLDPALICGLPRRKLNQRVAVGLGVLPRVVADGMKIHRGKITLNAAQQRLLQHYHPFHNTLAQLILEQKQRFGICVLFDFHSMPHNAVKSNIKSSDQLPEIILGDRFGLSCDRWVADGVESAFQAEGFNVVRNVPFAGGYITQHYGQPKNHIHAIQIEIDRSLYMDEQKICPLPDFDRFRMRIIKVIENIAVLGPRVQKIAAE